MIIDYAIKTLRKHFENKEIFHDDKTDVDGYTAIDGKTFIINFFGTGSKKDVIIDLMAYKQIMPYGNTSSKIKVHRGFIKAYKNIRDELHKRFKAEKEIENVFVSGFSLGAAMATLAAVDFQYIYPDTKIECCTAGSPRVGNRAFAKSYNKRVPDTIRLKWGNDIITLLPFSILLYKHIGEKISIGPKCFLSFCHNFNLYLNEIEDLCR